MRPIEAGAARESDFTRVNEGVHTVAVELDFVRQPGPFGASRTSRESCGFTKIGNTPGLRLTIAAFSTYLIGSRFGSCVVESS